MADKNKKRVDLDIRPYPSPLFRNYDYTSEGPNETSPGGGPYYGTPGGGEKSMGDWVKKRRKKLEERKNKLSVAEKFEAILEKRAGISESTILEDLFNTLNDLKTIAHIIKNQGYERESVVPDIVKEFENIVSILEDNRPTLLPTERPTSIDSFEEMLGKNPTILTDGALIVDKFQRASVANKFKKVIAGHSDLNAELENLKKEMCKFVYELNDYIRNGAVMPLARKEGHWVLDRIFDIQDRLINPEEESVETKDKEWFQTDYPDEEQGPATLRSAMAKKFERIIRAQS